MTRFMIVLSRLAEPAVPERRTRIRGNRKAAHRS
jgi:hypothetical protein